MRSSMFRLLAALLITWGGLAPSFAAGPSAPAAVQSGRLPAYLGPIAGRTFVPTDDGGSGNTQTMTQTHHPIMDTQTGVLRVTYPNWRKAADGVASSEVANAQAATGRMSVLYTDGQGNVNIARLYDATTGSDTLTAAAGANFVGVTQNPIPAIEGRQFYMRFWGNFPGNMQFAQNQADVGGGDFFQFGGTVADVTGTQTAISDSYAQGRSMYGPLAVEMLTTKPTVCIGGDSRGSGLADVPDGPRGLSGNVPRLVGNTYAFMNLSVPGEMIQNWAGRRPRSFAMMQHCSDIYLSTGFNDVMNNGRSATQAMADWQAQAQLFPGKRVYAMTANPDVGGSGDVTTTPRTGSVAAIAPWNQLIRSLPKGMSGFYDPAGVLESITNPGAYASATFISTDRVHETNTGNQRAAIFHNRLAMAAMGNFAPVPLILDPAPSGFSYPAGAAYQSLDFSDGWSTQGATLALNNRASPANDNKAALITEDTTASSPHAIFKQPALTLAGTTRTFTVFVKRVTGTRNMQIQVQRTSDYASSRCVINLGNGTTIYNDNSAGTAGPAVITAYNDYYKVACPITFAAGTPANPYIFIKLADGGGADSYTGDGASSIAAWGLDAR